jgi:uncharacterized protein
LPNSVSLTLGMADGANAESIRQWCIQHLGDDKNQVKDIVVKKRSVDARSRSIKVHVDVELFFEGETTALSKNYLPEVFQAQTGRFNSSAHIIGAGPAGLFAALRLLALGIKPIIIERGKTVKDRRRDLAALTKNHIVNSDSNYCFGEGGAGTYSDGKLYTRSHKRGNIQDVLQALVYFGAGDEIRYEAHPHIGTNKLPGIIERIRNYILEAGGEIHFNTRLIDFGIEKGNLKYIVTRSIADNELKEHSCQHLILATGHSARDIYELLFSKGVLLEAKPFALGFRIEHPQEIIDRMQYRCGIGELPNIRTYMPAASYALVTQADNKGVYSFCMCPGGIIAPCATEQNQVVTNGWSPSKRNNRFANSGMVTAIDETDWKDFIGKGPLAAMAYQADVEHRAWKMAGQTQSAPAQRMVDFIQKKQSNSLPECSYLPGIVSVDMDGVLPRTVVDRLRTGLSFFGKNKKEYLTNEAVVVATESRTSTPVRIPRNQEDFQHPQVKGLYPCGEGAGYAGGIVSAAMDGIKVANAVLAGGK